MTFTGSSTTKLDREVNEFLARPDIVVRRLYPAMSFGSYMVVVEYEAQHPVAAPSPFSS